VTDRSASTGEPKVSIHSFHPVRVLGEGGFGKVLLAKKAALDGSEQLVAIKMLKKAHIINCCNVSSTITEKQSLILASEHPFVTTLYSCFQMKVIFNFLNPLYISREALIVKFIIRMKLGYFLGAFIKL
jgi:serine/threonine protein kinase